MTNRVSLIMACRLLIALVLVLTIQPVLAGTDHARVQIHVDSVEREVSVIVVLSKCRSRWSFRSDYPGSRSTLWEGLDEFSWSGDDLVRSDGKCFKKISFTTSLDQDAVDRTYPFIVASSLGFAVYAQHALPSDIERASVTLSVASEKCNKQSRAPMCIASGRLRGGAWVGGGPYVTSIVADQVSNDGIQTISENDVPKWISEEVIEYATSAYLAAGRAFGPIGGSGTPVFVMFNDRGAGATWRGWSSGKTVFLLFSGKQWQTRTAELSKVVDNFVTHEVLHLWNAWKYDYDPSTPAWLTEGFAEYFSIALRKDAGRLTDKEASAEVLSGIGRCIDSLAGGHSEGSSVLSGRAVYDCGVAANWAIDQVESDLGGSAWSFWRETFKGLRGERYGIPDIAARPEIQDGLNWLLRGSKPKELISFVKSRGLVVLEDYSSENARQKFKESIYTHLLAQECDAPPYGFFQFEGYEQLDTGTRCGALNGDPRVTGVNGHDLSDGDIKAAVDAMVKACTSAAVVLLDKDGGGTLPVDCRNEYVPVRAPIEATCPGQNIACANPSADRVPLRSTEGVVPK